MTRLPKRMTRRRAERLLGRRGSADDRVTMLVDAAAAPATPAELSREADARHEFRAATAQREAARAGEPPAPVLRRATRFTTRVGIAAAAVFVAITGLAVAAVAGALPARLQRPAHDLFHVPAPSERTQNPQPTGTSPQPSRASTSGSSSAATPTSPTNTGPTSTRPTSTVPTTSHGTTTAGPSTATVPSSRPSPPTSSAPTPSTPPVSAKPTKSPAPPSTGSAESTPKSP